MELLFQISKQQKLLPLILVGSFQRDIFFVEVLTRLNT